MEIFVMTLEDDALEWFYDCTPKEISSLSVLIKACSRAWDHGHVEGSHEAYVMVEIAVE